MEKTFEASLNELEAVVQQLENGDLPLEESLKLFEDGVRLSRECRERLTSAERRIEVLMKDGDGNLVLQDLDTAAASTGKKDGIKRIVFGDDEDS
ncbi:MAG TPA: exodeoxyribonuclease VII small subunit [Pyrinomonadaceae bacterium]|nr:exodeoxyribonuclease VII small subunit [Pyrinomonadaceae bacterium]